ncbi:hypothetical protein SUGI_0745890 [Cryptomeria japonica]|nr:hypothetical protein SUGI_0745890 [Cryptomeria japonica]
MAVSGKFLWFIFIWQIKGENDGSSGDLVEICFLFGDLICSFRLLLFAVNLFSERSQKSRVESWMRGEHSFAFAAAFFHS